MTNEGPRVLFISGSLGMGHVTRDLAIVGELRRSIPNVQLEWLAGEPALTVLRNAGERIVPNADNFSNENVLAEQMTDGYRLNLAQWMPKASKDWKESFKKYLEIVKKGNYDLVVGDEAYEVIIGYNKDISTKKVPFIIMFDFVKSVPVTNSLSDRFILWFVNKSWQDGYKAYRKGRQGADDLIFIGEKEDVPDEKLGIFLANARKVSENQEFVGYVLRFDPLKLRDVEAQKKKLGYGSEKLVLVTIGGTNVGKDLLELCGKAYPFLKQSVPDVRMVIVAGPRVDPKDVKVPEGVEVRGYVADLHEHMAASDLVIAQAGGTTTIELTALRRPFLYFPLEEHFEQLGAVVPRLHRHKAGVEMRFYKTTPESLAEEVVKNIGKKVEWAEVPTDGASRCAEIIVKHLNGK